MGEVLLEAAEVNVFYGASAIAGADKGRVICCIEANSALFCLSAGA